MASATTDTITGRLLGKFTGWIGRIRDAGEIRGLSAAEAEALAHDLRVSPGELETLAFRGRKGADELPQMLTALGIDPKSVVRKEPGVLRDMTLVCALCAEKARCNRDLAKGVAAEHYRDYCANAYTIDALDEKPKEDQAELLLRGPCCC